MLKQCIILAFAISLSFEASSQTERSNKGADKQKLSFVQVFERFCVKNVSRSENLMKDLFDQKAITLPSEKVSRHIHQIKAWRLEVFSDEFVISLRGDGTCSLHAKKIHQDLAEKEFSDLAAAAPVGKNVNALRNQRSNYYPFHMITFMWSSSSHESKSVLTLSTTADPQAPYQAVASITEIK